LNDFESQKLDVMIFSLRDSFLKIIPIKSEQHYSIINKE